MKVHEAIDNISSSLSDMTSLDNEIISDHLKYSEWLLGIATAGFALVVGRFKSIVSPSWIENALVGSNVLMIACILFMVSAVYGAKVKIKTSYIKEIMKKRLSLIIEQNLEIQMGVNTKITSDSLLTKDIIKKTSHGFYLDDDRMRNSIENSFEKLDEFSDTVKQFLRIQQGSVAIGYCMLFVVFVPK